MTTTNFRGVVHGGKITLLNGATALADGTEVLITPVAGAPGSPSAVLAAMEKAPTVPSDWVDELEQVIAMGRRPPVRRSPLQGESSALGNR